MELKDSFNEMLIEIAETLKLPNDEKHFKMDVRVNLYLGLHHRPSTEVVKLACSYPHTTISLLVPTECIDEENLARILELNPEYSEAWINMILESKNYRL